MAGEFGSSWLPTPAWKNWPAKLVLQDFYRRHLGAKAFSLQLIAELQIMLIGRCVFWYMGRQLLDTIRCFKIFYAHPSVPL